MQHLGKTWQQKPLTLKWIRLNFKCNRCSALVYLQMLPCKIQGFQQIWRPINAPILQRVCSLLSSLSPTCWLAGCEIHLVVTTSRIFIYCTWGCTLLWIPWREDWVTGDMMNWFFTRYSLNNDVGDYYPSTGSLHLPEKSIPLLNQLHRRFSRGFLLCT